TAAAGKVDLSLGTLVIDEQHSAVVTGGLVGDLGRRRRWRWRCGLVAGRQRQHRQADSGPCHPTDPHTDFLLNASTASASGATTHAASTASRTAGGSGAALPGPARPL